MVTTRSEWFLRLARWYARRRIAADLDGLYVSGAETARVRLQEGPVLFASNHVAWWDPILLLPLDKALESEGYALMDAANLRRLPFFGWAGAIPLDRSSPIASRRGLKNAAEILTHPGRSVWVFPQGRQRPSWLRPLDLRPGVRLLARLSGARVIPVSLTYAFREAPQPSAVVRFGTPLEPRRQDLMAAIEERIVEGLVENDRFIESGEGYTPLVQPRGQRREDGVGARLLVHFGRSSG
jgi:1-acyl-sn-glycerol-3-phosphate acyltransferase